jgi:hypothetical protein
MHCQSMRPGRLLSKRDKDAGSVAYYVRERLRTPYVRERLRTPYVRERLRTPYVRERLRTPYRAAQRPSLAQSVNSAHVAEVR